MASVRSLGLHQPTCLPKLISEGILPPDPGPQQYRWRLLSPSLVDDETVEEELVITRTCVVWSKGCLVEQIYRFDVENEDVIDACFTRIRASNSTLSLGKSAHPDARNDSATNGVASSQINGQPKLQTRPLTQSGTKVSKDSSVKGPEPEGQGHSSCRALVVLLQTQARIFMPSQTSHIVHIPFEVDALFPTIHGVLLRRKTSDYQPHGSSPVIPAAPQNTFAFSQSSVLSLNDPFELPDAQLLDPLDKLLATSKHDQCDDLPRLFSLTDPLAQLGAVVVDGRQTSGLLLKSQSRKSSASWVDDFDANERLLYISAEDEIPRFNLLTGSKLPLTVGVSVNAVNGTTRLWTLTFDHQPGLKDERLPRSSSRRRSSFASRISTGANTPLNRSFRQPSRDNPVEESNSQPQGDTLDSVFEHANGASRSSRRVSSLLARTDLSTDQERATFVDFASAGHASRKARRGPSSGGLNKKATSDYATSSFNARLASPYGIEPDQNHTHFSTLFPDTLMDGSAATEGAKVALATVYPAHGLPLPRDTTLRCIHVEAKKAQDTVSFDSRWDESDTHCFTLEFPSGCLQQSETAAFLVCIMFRKRAELLIMRVRASCHYHEKEGGARKQSSNATKFTMDVSGTWHSGVLDACKISQGSHSWLLILDAKGGALTMQAPWSAFLRLDLPSTLNLYNISDLSSQASPRNEREGGPKRTLPEGLKLVKSLGQASRLGRVDVIDFQNQAHRFEVAMQPSQPFVDRMVKVCQAVLPYSETNADAILRGWWDSMRWLKNRSDDGNNDEWTALVILIFSLATHSTSDGKRVSEPRQRKRKGGLLRSSSGAQIDTESWDEMIRQEGARTLGIPAWAREQSAWAWTFLDEDHEERSPSSKRSMLTHNIVGAAPQNKVGNVVQWATLSKEFAASGHGQSAFGRNGYLPVALSRDSDARSNALISVLIALHLLREELKLDIASGDNVRALTPVLAQLGTWLHWKRWSSHQSSYYMTEDLAIENSAFDESVIPDLQNIPERMAPPSIFAYLEQLACKNKEIDFPTLLDAADAPLPKNARELHVVENVLKELTPRTYLLANLFPCIARTPQKAVPDALLSAQLNPATLDTFPESVAAPFRAIISRWQMQPSVDWGSEVLARLGREDISSLDHTGDRLQQPRSLQTHHAGASHDAHHACSQAFEVERVSPYDGSAEIDRQSVTRILFAEDQRFAEAAKLVHPLQNPVVQCIAGPGWSESDLLDAQQELAKIVAMRTLSVCLGRSLLFFRARLPMLTERYPTHGFTLSTTIKPSGTTVTVDRTLFSEDIVSWAFFHAGVESGLSISDTASGIDASWILFNKPKELNNRHAGFLLALGLNGHLRSMAKWVAFKYLTPKHNITSIGLLLGLSASYIGTMDTLITRLLSVHITRMLPPGAAELNLAPLTQTCGIFGMGLLYCGTQHRRMSEIMLSEMENMEVEDVANPMESLRDEGYRLATGFALGFINLRKGKDLKGLRDMQITERLLALAVAIKVVDQVQISDTSTTGAIIAIALIFMKTNDQALANKIDVPNTVQQFEYVRPDLFLLRTVTKHLILWDKVAASPAWLAQQLPSAFRTEQLQSIVALRTEDLPYLNTLAGLCFSIGLRYAGSGRVEARDTLWPILDHFMRLCRLPASTYDAKVARITVRNCQDLLALSAACVMAGTGDITVFRRLRSLHGRTDSDTPYGSHLAAHFAIGILFLGGGTYTFCTSDLAVASLLCAFFPLFPSSVLDNKAHLQAFRHFWVLAAEQRCLIPRDLETRRPLSVPITIVFRDGHHTTRKAPCLLPEYSDIAQIYTLAPDYWPVTLDFVSNPNHLLAFKKHQSVFLRQQSAFDATNISIFAATTRALQARMLTRQLRRQPFEWILDLQAFRGLDRAERALILPEGSGINMTSLAKMVQGSIVDDRLMLENCCLESQRSERLFNLRLLLAWAEACEKGGSGIRWLREEVIEGLRARLALHRSGN